MAAVTVVDLFNVLARRIRRAGVRTYRTPKSKHCFTQHEHLTVLVFKTLTRSSYRDIEMLAPLLLSRTMDHSTPEKAARRLGPQLLLRLLVICLPSTRGKIVAIDSTGRRYSLQRFTLFLVMTCVTHTLCVIIEVQSTSWQTKPMTQNGSTNSCKNSDYKHTFPCAKMHAKDSGVKNTPNDSKDESIINDHSLKQQTAS